MNKSKSKIFIYPNQYSHFNKKGLSGIVVTLIIIGIALAAVGIVFYVINVVTEEQSTAVTDASSNVFQSCESVGYSKMISTIGCDGMVKYMGGEKCCTGSLSGKSCLELLENGFTDDGIYFIDPNRGDTEDAFEVNCDMTRDGGGWTLMLKTWYTVEENNVFKKTGAVGDVSDGLTNLDSGYKLSDGAIRNIIGPGQKFDILADQSGYNTAYSTGNYEYVILRDYTGYWKFDGPVAASTTTTTFQSYRKSDNALAWTGNLACGYNAGSGAPGINCVTVLSNNPQGGAGCVINMGTASNPGWHYFFMSQYNQDTYMYICNGAQHSSNDRFSARFWVRESS